ncbi:SNF2 family DNA-dependent ATPase domain-containing protein [Polychaeton citri CBS 116435]|uniref:SNF2 family DNA-dependent ATPase domain-containing protein n=1 Tax=Polychaeton citri CBS 116435 TaxID=1314669 RepID=A0A9P4UL07_9PEZI|nr:SNF2 family DNA-dependent ATPase domain-containing protein [Polychaeton citri CBS 116435]
MARSPQSSRKNPKGKRKRVEVDLTADSDEEVQAQPKKQQQSSQNSNDRTDSVLSSGLPYSSQSRSSHSTVAVNNFRPNNGYQHVYSSPYGLPDTTHSEAERESWLTQEDDATADEVVGSQSDSSEDLQLYSEINTKIVGVRYYNGYANPGEHVLIRREPGNPYDSNAIRIDNVAAQQIGHMPKTMATRLAKFVDNRWAKLEGALAGRKGEFDCPLFLRLYGPDPRLDAGIALMEQLRSERISTGPVLKAERDRKKREEDQENARKKMLTEARRAAASQGDSGAHIPTDAHSQWANHNTADGLGLGEPPNMDDILNFSQRFSPRQIKESADKYGVSEEILKNMPLAKSPEVIKTKMLPYQLQGLKWLVDQENPQLPNNSQEAVQLWKKQGNVYTNLATQYSQSSPKLAHGGILADDMGLGKTLEMIALIAADKEHDPGNSGPTLIVSPLSVMSNWADQASRHVKEQHALRVYIYHATGRNEKMTSKDFAKYDIVITTYGTLAVDYVPRNKSAAPPKELRKNGLYSVEWRRIILDEGHTVRNPNSKGAKAACAIFAKCRWILTGTPIVNSLKDLYSAIKFIGVTGGLESLEVCNSVLIRPLKAGDESATALLHAIMSAFVLRRNKDMSFIDLKLPTLNEYKHIVDFSKKERERYEALEKEAKGTLASFEENAATGGKTSNAFQHLLEILLRMRQCCNHWQLCGERVNNLLAQLDKAKTVDLTPENRRGLQGVLQVHIESQEDCPICLETLHQPVITACAHPFGRSCIEQVIETQHKCPMCRAELRDAMKLVEPANEHGDEEVDRKMDISASSTKLEALVKILNASKSSRDKTIVFSQWTRFLDIIETRLQKEGYKYCRIDGTMPAAKRDLALHALEYDDDCTIMLASLGVCAVGLNLTAANQIILSDTWWAPAIEDQAVDRVHRLGQKKECKVFRLVMEGSLEEKTLEVQQEKRKLMMLAFGERSNKRDQSKARALKDIRTLLGPR